MIQFECPRVIYPLVLFNIWVHCGVSISLYAGNGKCCMWLVNRVEIHFAKIGSMDCKWSNLNTPMSYTPFYQLFRLWRLWRSHREAKWMLTPYGFPIDFDNFSEWVRVWGTWETWVWTQALTYLSCTFSKNSYSRAISRAREPWWNWASIWSCQP